MHDATPTNEVQRGEPQGAHVVPSSQAEKRPLFAMIGERGAQAFTRPGADLPGQNVKAIRILDRIEVGHPTGCWLWLGHINKAGYGAHGDSKNKCRLVHRWAYTYWRGPIPEGLAIDHLCRVRNCVNPWHLEPVTWRENLLRGDTIAARNAAKTHCVHGHEFTEANTRLRHDGGTTRRACRQCERNREHNRVRSSA